MHTFVMYILAINGERERDTRYEYVALSYVYKYGKYTQVFVHVGDLLQLRNGCLFWQVLLKKDYTF